MNTSSDRMNSPANDFQSLGQFAPFLTQNFNTLTPIAPLAITLPLFYKQTTSAQPDTGESSSPFPVRGDGATQKRSSDITSAQFTRMALRGCEIAEKIVLNHKNRPCFKKIDSLCARLKQDLVRPDNVLANINSQGIAWAVKDMIFTFTRIINAWIIVKGYMYDTSAGLKKVKEYCSDDFDESFLKWQDATLDFLDKLTDSFEKLDYHVQTQKNRFGSGKKDEKEFRKRNSNASTESRDSDFMDDFHTMSPMTLFPTVAHERKMKSDSEGGGYIRTGIYNPLQTTRANVQIDPDQLLLWEQNVFSQRTSTPTAVESPVKLTPQATSDPMDYHKEKYGTDPEETLILILLSKLYEMRDASLFFNKHFTKNYVPDYVALAFTCKDIKTIMVAIEKRSYKTLLDIVKDLVAIVYDAKAYLKKHPDNDFLATNTHAFENEVKTILNEEIFSNYTFTNIFIYP